MNIYSIIPIIAFLFNGFVWTYIFAQKKQNQINRAFLIYAAFLAMWILIVIILRQNVSSVLIMPLMKIASISWLSIAFLFMNFTYEFINKRRDTFYFSCLGLVILSIVISLSTNLILKDFEYVNWGVNKIVGSLFLPSVLIDIIIPGSYSIFLISKEKKITKNNNLKHSLSLLLIGSLITLLIGLLSNVVIPLFMNYKHFVEFAESGTVIQSVFIFRAMIKYKLFSVGFEEAAKDIFTNIQDSVIIIDVQGNISQMNNAAEKFFGMKLSGTNEAEIKTLLPGFNRFEDNKNLEMEIKVGNVSKFILLTKTKISEGGEEIGRLLIIKDITEHRLAEEAIRKSEIKFRSVWENSADAMRLTDENCTIVSINRAFCRLVRMNEEELIGKPLTITYEGMKDTSSMIKNYISRFKTRNIPTYLEQKLILRNSQILHLEISNSFVELDNGKSFLLGIFRDVTERINAHQKITMLGHTITSLNECVSITDLNNNIISVNPAFLNTYGYDEIEILGKNISMIRSLKNPSGIAEEILVETFNSGWHGELINTRKNGEEFPILLSSSVVRDETGLPIALVGVSHDITEQKELQRKLDEAIKERMQDMQMFSISLQRAQEDERTKIAREIHDELGQVLTALKMDVILLSEDIKDSKKFSSENIISELESIAKLIDNSIQSVRDIATELRPDILDHLGIIAAIKWQSQEFHKRNRIKCSVHSELEYIELEKNKSTATFRIFQEILTNILRHADSSEVNVSILKEDNNFILQVRDNGKGINEDDINNLKSIGIIGMRERTEIIGGQFHILGEKDKGTLVTLKVPLTNENIKVGTNYSKEFK